MSEQEVKGIVIDNGSCQIKAGFSGDDAPHSVFASRVGRLKQKGQEQIIVGDEALTKKQQFSISSPINGGVITDWADMSRVWRHCFSDQLNISPINQNIFLCDSPLNTKRNREQSCQVIFEDFQARGFYIQLQEVLSLYFSGRTSGIVVDFGFQQSVSLPIYDGYVQGEQKISSFGGKDVSELLQTLLKNDGIDLSLDVCTDIKKRYARVCDLSPAVVRKENQDDYVTYLCPDGQEVKISGQVSECAEPFFRSNYQNYTNTSVQQCVVDAINSCQHEIKQSLFQNIILVGGSSLIKNIDSRMQCEVQDLCQNQVKVTVQEGRKYSAFVGASMLSSLPTFESLWITKGEYDEVGQGIASKKCM